MGVWGLPAERVVCICSCRDMSWGVTRSGGTRDPAARPQCSWNGNQKHCRRRDAPALLPVRRPRHSPLSPPGGSSRLPAGCLQFLTAPPCPGASCFPGGTFSGSGNREFYSGCSSECTKGKEFRSQSLKLPHFSLSQMTVSVFGIGGQAGVLGGRQGCAACSGACGQGLCNTPVSLPQWKACSSPHTCLSSPLAGPYQN